jgi:plasmid maintenance system antidote protein VapI
MSRSVRDQLDDVPLKPLKVSLPPDTDPLNKIEPGDYVVLALARAGISQKSAALTMGIPEPQFSRQLKGQEHLSFQRLLKLNDDFWRELWVLLAIRRKLARVRRRVTFELSA